MISGTWTCCVLDRLPSIAGRFHAGETFAQLLQRPKLNGELWEALYKRARISEGSLMRARALSGRWNVLVLNEDWCGDSVNVLPFLARLKEASTNIDMRILSRDSNPDIMDAHLTANSRSIPVVIVYDEEFVERGWWGPRPGPLQEWVLAEGLALARPERYREVRTWYARDRGETLVSEVLAIMEKAAKGNEKAAF